MFLSSLLLSCFSFLSLCCYNVIMNNEFRSIADIRKWFMQFRLVVYTKDRDMDLELMEGEIKEAYEAGLLEQNDYQKALLIIKQEKRMQN